MRDRIGGCAVVAAALGLSLLAPGARADECSDAVPDPLDGFAAAVDAAIPGASSRAESRALERAREALARRGSSIESRAAALRGAAAALDRVPGWPLFDEAWDACDAFRREVADEARELQRVLTMLLGVPSSRLQARLDALSDAVDGSLAVGRSVRAAADLHRAARLLAKSRVPRLARYGGPFRVVSVDVEGVNDVPLNRPVVIRFSDRVDPSSVRADTIPIRRGTNFAIQVPGTYETLGCLVVFRPKLPTLPDHSDAGFPADTTFRVSMPGLPSAVTVRSAGGRPNSAPHAAEFRTTADPRYLFSSRYFLDDLPARVACTVPADALPVAPWTDPGGAKDVPTNTPIRLVLNRVPLQGSSVVPPEVELVMTSVRGAPTEARIPGRVELVQDLLGVTLSFEPSLAARPIAVRAPDLVPSHRPLRQRAARRPRGARRPVRRRGAGVRDEPLGPARVLRRRAPGGGRPAHVPRLHDTRRSALGSSRLARVRRDRRRHRRRRRRGSPAHHGVVQPGGPGRRGRDAARRRR
jgi:hypothetical protein